MELASNFIKYNNLLFNIVNREVLEDYLNEIINIKDIKRFKCSNGRMSNKYIIITKDKNEYIFKNSNTVFVKGYDWSRHIVLHPIFDESILDLLTVFYILSNQVENLEKENAELKLKLKSKN